MARSTRERTATPGTVSLHRSRRKNPQALVELVPGSASLRLGRKEAEICRAVEMIRKNWSHPIEDESARFRTTLPPIAEKGRFQVNVIVKGFGAAR
ncbi:MAG: hypothetical protein ABJB12_11595 [Pseudomonadota bacterium]